MLLFENISMAVNGLLANKMRAALTMLGIIIGIGSVIGIVTVANSMSAGISESMRGLGVSNITLSLEEKTEDNTKIEENRFIFGRSEPEEQDMITDEMLEQYRQQYGDNISYIYFSEMMGNGSASYNTEEENVSVTGINEEYGAANSIDILTGRFIKDSDGKAGKKVCVISSELCGDLMPMEDPIGKSLDITINGNTYVFYIVGVYDGSSSSSIMSISTGESVYIPIDVAKKLNGSSRGYQSVNIVPSANTDTSYLTNITTEYFTRLYSGNKSYTASASNMEGMVSIVTDMLSTISTAIAVIAGISLLVGGIGVMNIMLVSITERTREIGTRKALGATNGSIRTQFIVESMIICLIGGILGIILGVTMGNIGASFLGYKVSVSPAVVAGAVGFSMAIGVFFGYYPANKAAKLNPIEALRYE